MWNDFRHLAPFSYYFVRFETFFLLNSTCDSNVEHFTLIQLINQSVTNKTRSLTCVLVFRVIPCLSHDEKRRSWLSGRIRTIEKKNALENSHSLFWWFLNKMVKDRGLCSSCFESTECTRLKLRSYSLVEVRKRPLLYAVSAYVMGKDESVACLEACSSVALGESCF